VKQGVQNVEKGGISERGNVSAVRYKEEGEAEEKLADLKTRTSGVHKAQRRKGIALLNQKTNPYPAQSARLASYEASDFLVLEKRFFSTSD
jgi:hypothetical protein